MQEIKLQKAEKQVVIRPIAYGISGRNFLFTTAFTLVVFMILGLILAGQNGTALVDYLFRIFSELTTKAAVAFLFASLIAYVMFVHVLDYTIGGLKAAFQESKNDSHAILLAGVILTSIALVTMAGGNSFTVFVSNILIKGSLAIGIATLITSLVAYLFGVTSMDSFRDWMLTEDNDSYAFLTAAVMIGTTVLVMSV